MPEGNPQVGEVWDLPDSKLGSCVIAYRGLHEVQCFFEDRSTRRIPLQEFEGTWKRGPLGVSCQYGGCSAEALVRLFDGTPRCSSHLPAYQPVLIFGERSTLLFGCPACNTLTLPDRSSWQVRDGYVRLLCECGSSTIILALSAQEATIDLTLDAVDAAMVVIAQEPGKGPLRVLTEASAFTQICWRTKKRAVYSCHFYARNFLVVTKLPYLSYEEYWVFEQQPLVGSLWEYRYAPKHTTCLSRVDYKVGVANLFSFSHPFDESLTCGPISGGDLLRDYRCTFDPGAAGVDLGIWNPVVMPPNPLTREILIGASYYHRASGTLSKVLTRPDWHPFEAIHFEGPGRLEMASEAEFRRAHDGRIYPESWLPGDTYVFGDGHKSSGKLLELCPGSAKILSGENMLEVSLQEFSNARLQSSTVLDRILKGEGV